MRDIRFRAFDKNGDGMFYNIETGIQFDDGSHYTFDKFLNPDADDIHEWEIMQFTGLHDKNGKDIFEGDFFQRPVKINNSLHGSWTIYQFMIKNGNTIISYLRSEKDTGIPEGYMAALYTDELDIDMKTLMFAKEVTLYQVEILGNIYEHPQLIEKQ